MPALKDDTRPEAGFTVATAMLLLLHVPPVTGCDRLVVAPAQIVAVPVMAAATLLIVTWVLLVQPAPTVYMMLASPALTPDTTPVVRFTLALSAASLLHVPPDVALLSVVVCPTHTTAVPVLAPMPEFTVTVAVLAQPVPII